MFSHVRADERTERNDAQAFGTAAAEGGFDQRLPEMPAADGIGNLGVNDRQGVVGPLVRQEGRLAVDGQLEALQRGIVRNRRTRRP